MHSMQLPHAFAASTLLPMSSATGRLSDITDPTTPGFGPALVGDCTVPGTPRKLATAGIMACLVSTAFVGSVVTTAMPTIVQDLGEPHLYAWVFTAFLVASTLSVTLSGKLADRFGRRVVFTCGMGLFLVGSVLCGASESMTALVAFRVVQGLGAGVVAPISTTISADLYTLEERARVHGLFTGAWGVANLIGPPLGGAMSTSMSWRWVFLLNVPLGLIAVGLLLFSYRDARPPVREPLDLTGAALAAVVVSCWVLATGESTGIPMAGHLGFAGVAIVVGLLFARQQKRATDPLVPVLALRDPTVRANAIASLFVGALVHAPAAFVPLWLAEALPHDPIGASWALVPLLVGWAVGSTLGVRVLVRKGPRYQSVRGLVLAATSATGLAMVVAFHLPLAAAFVALGALGLGLGGVANATLLGSQARVSWQSRGAVTSMLVASRTLGGSLAIGLLAVVTACSGGPGAVTFVALAAIVWFGWWVVATLSPRSGPLESAVDG
jgi:MFS family permease